MAGLGCFEDDLNGFAVAHLAHQNNFRRLAKGGAQSVREAGGIAVKFPLMDGGAFVVVQELDGIFDGNDVIIFLAIDEVEKDGEG